MRHLSLLGHCAVAGALTGAGLAPLQLVLWPHLHLGAWQALLALLAWSSWGALWGGLVFFVLAEGLVLLLPRHGRRLFTASLWRYLAVTVTFVLASAAWWNREAAKFLLAARGLDALRVTGMLTGAALLGFFVLALRGWPKTRPSVVLLPVLAGTVAGLWVVWLASPPVSSGTGPGREPPRFSAASKLVFVCWEGADLAWLLPAMERGDMPFLRERWERGAWGQLRALRPFIRSASLTSLVTGCAPATHGVVGRRSYRLPWLTETPVTLMLAGPWPQPHHLPWRAWERTAGPMPDRATLWQILKRSNLRAGIAGWPPYLNHADWALLQSLASEVVPYARLDSVMRSSLDPALAALPGFSEQARNAIAIASDLGDRVVQTAAREPVDALLVSDNLPSRLRPVWTTESADAPTEEVLRQCARMLDGELQRIWNALGDEDALLVVTSPYGLAPPSSWQRIINIVSRNTRWRVSPDESPDGFLLVSGPGVKRGTRIRGARLADVTPTVLYLLQLPVARDMSGRVLSEAIDEDRAAGSPLRLVLTYPAPEPTHAH